VLCVRYQLGSYIPEDGIPHSHRSEDVNSYIMKPYMKKGMQNLYYRAIFRWPAEKSYMYHTLGSLIMRVEFRI
jgi:hypothetical protein